MRTGFNQLRGGAVYSLPLACLTIPSVGLIVRVTSNNTTISE